MNQGQRILLLEDNPEFALVLKTWLRADFPGEVVHASDIPQAREQLAQHAWDLLITDIELPSGNCFELVGQAKANHPNLQVMVMTSHQRADYAVEALRLKADEFLFKPFERQELAGKLSALLENASARRLRRVVLAVGAHPDDVEIACGGTLRAHALAGDTVHILTLTMGEAGGDKQVRQAESRRAAAVIGAGLSMCDLPDTRISEGAETITEIEKVIREVNPGIIYTHSANDAHQDHRNVYRATVVAARRVPTLLCYQAPSATVDFKPARFTEISGCLDAKLQAIAAFGSQAMQRPYMTPAMIEATARYWGRFAGYGLCEPFEAVRVLTN